MYILIKISPWTLKENDYILITIISLNTERYLYLDKQLCHFGIH